MPLIKNLSEVFPEDTAYFYGYPTGWDETSRFLNTAPVSAEDLVAARALVCAGEKMSVVVFARTVEERITKALEGELGTELCKRRIVIPSELDTTVTCQKRNERMKAILSESLADKTLVMAQPYLGGKIENKYLINPRISTWANDKANMRDFVPEEYLTPEFARAESGAEFATMEAKAFPYPCVVKVSASSAGDGVRICKTEADFKEAQSTFSQYDCPVLVLKFIRAVAEIAPKFAIYPGSDFKSARLGASKDFSSSKGEWVGSFVGENVGAEVAERIYEVLETKVLPKLHAKGWYGVGEGGALIDAEGNFYFHDFNCRVTGDMAQTLQWNQGLFPKRQLVVFNGIVTSDFSEFIERIKPIAQRGSPDQILNLVAAAQYPEGIRVHGGVLMDQKESLMENIGRLESSGIKSDLFDRMHELHDL